MKQPNNYGKEFTEVYDNLMNHSKYKAWKDLLKKLVNKYHISKGRVIDIACGSGEISKIMLDMGFSVIGIDFSKFMIRKAKEKLKKYKTKVKYLVSDISDFRLPPNYDLAVSFYDSLNYLLELSKIEKMFSCVNKALKKGGYFIFDMNTKEKIKVLQKKPMQDFRVGNKIIKFEHSGKNNLWKLKINVKKKGNKKIYQEIHFERGYSPKEIIAIARKRGFALLEVINDKKSKGEKKYINRQYYTLRKI